MKAKNQSLQGELNQTVGLLGEYQLAYEMLSHQKFSLDFYFAGLEQGDQAFQIQSMDQRFFVQSGNQPKRELDLRVKGVMEVQKSGNALDYEYDLKFVEAYKAEVGGEE